MSSASVVNVQWIFTFAHCTNVNIHLT